MKKRIVLISFLCVIVCNINATMKFKLHFDVVKHYINVELNMDSLTDGNLTMVLPMWAPGYYNLAYYPKNITDFSPTDNNGAPLKWKKEGASRWIIYKNNAHNVKLTYRVYSNFNNVCMAIVDSTRAFVPLNGICMYRLDNINEPVELTVTPFNDWRKLTTVLDVLDKMPPYRIFAHNYDELYDSPILMGNQETAKFELEGHGYEIAWPQGDSIDHRIIPDLKKMIKATTNLFGDIPYKDYKFLWLGKGEGGLEHAACQADLMDTCLVYKDTIGYLKLMSYVAHEFFHLYNIKRIRPVELGPFDYEKENYTTGLWWCEGLTSLYNDYSMIRGGVCKGDFLLYELNDFISRIEGFEGHKHSTLLDSSYDGWLFNYDSNEDTRDRRFSYYFKGPIVGFLLDIDIRHKTNNKHSLDDVMRKLYTEYYQGLKRGFTEDELWTVIEKVAGCNMDEIRRYVSTTDEIDYNRLLGYAGLQLKGFNIEKMKKCDKLAFKIRKSLLGE